ncbi:hypothetical protein [Enterococcus gilvus]|uniref:hypothetical protein n=1 Tax=Enterococcus gilvus TaxID=160453 RepID=UPI003ED95E84
MKKQTKVITLISSMMMGILGMNLGASFVHADTTGHQGTAKVTYSPEEKQIAGDNWDIVIPTAYAFTSGNDPQADSGNGIAVKGSVKLLDTYGNEYVGDKSIEVNVTSQNNGTLKDDKGNGVSTYQLQDDKEKKITFGETPFTTLAKGSDTTPVNAALTKVSKQSKGTYGDTLTFTAKEKSAPAQP